MVTRSKALITAVLLATLLPLSAGSAQDTTKKMMAGVTVRATSLGPTLVDTKGMTLYTWRNDTIPGKSVCNGPCATNWLPLTAAADAASAGDWSVVARDDGTKQWAYKGKPLYTYKSDANAGDVSGNGRGTWEIAKP